MLLVRQAKTKERPLPFLTHNRQIALVPLNNLVRNKQSNPETRIVLFRWITYAVETIEDMLLMLLLNPNTKISHAHNCPIFLRYQLHNDAITAGRILDRIGQ